MLLIFEVILIILGAIMLFTGKIDIGRLKGSGPNVRWAGVVLMMPMVIAFTLGMLIGVDENQDGTIDTDTLLSLSCLEFIGVIIAVGIAYYLITNRSDPLQKPLLTPVAELPHPKVMTIADAARYLRVSEQAVIDLIENGHLPAARIGDEYRVAQKAIDDYLQGV